MEQCIVDRDVACDAEAVCPATAERDCLRASVPFRSEYKRLECCFRCCVRHWLREAGLLRNIPVHQRHLKAAKFGRNGRNQCM